MQILRYTLEEMIEVEMMQEYKALHGDIAVMITPDIQNGVIIAVMHGHRW